MSYWSEWRCSAISDSEYTALCNREALMDAYYENKKFNDAFSDTDDEEFEEDETTVSKAKSCAKCKHYVKFVSKSGYTYDSCEYCKMRCDYEEVEQR